MPMDYQRANFPVPRQFSEARLTDFEGLELYWRDQNTFITGPNGAGKSHLAAALLREWGGSKWIDVSVLLAWITSTFRRGTEDTQDWIIKDAVEPKILVIDDLLACRKTEFAIDVLFRILRQREGAGVTIVTCDRALPEIETVESGLASRLGGFQRIRLEGPDRRLRREELVWRAVRKE